MGFSPKVSEKAATVQGATLQKIVNQYPHDPFRQPPGAVRLQIIAGQIQ
tara:strand:- start:13 stop:159 length:147 start_codon:yes stop_codon:yes gene_type:complete